MYFLFSFTAICYPTVKIKPLPHTKSKAIAVVIVLWLIATIIALWHLSTMVGLSTLVRLIQNF